MRSHRIIFYQYCTARYLQSWHYMRLPDRLLRERHVQILSRSCSRTRLQLCPKFLLQEVSSNKTTLQVDFHVFRSLTSDLHQVLACMSPLHLTWPRICSSFLFPWFFTLRSHCYFPNDAFLCIWTYMRILFYLRRQQHRLQSPSWSSFWASNATGRICHNRSHFAASSAISRVDIDKRGVVSSPYNAIKVVTQTAVLVIACCRSFSSPNHVHL